jgi:Cation transporter/ATPase, N-terminus
MSANNFNIKGLTDEQVLEARETHGYNRLAYKKENGFLDAVKSLAKEPMVIPAMAFSWQPPLYWWPPFPCTRMHAAAMPWKS